MVEPTFMFQQKKFYKIKSTCRVQVHMRWCKRILLIYKTKIICKKKITKKGMFIKRSFNERKDKTFIRSVQILRQLIFMISSKPLQMGVSG